MKLSNTDMETGCKLSVFLLPSFLVGPEANLSAAILPAVPVMGEAGLRSPAKLCLSLLSASILIPNQ